MRYFLVDTENVQQYDFLDYMEMNETDILIMFMTSASQKIRAIDLKKFIACRANIIFEEVYTGGDNALDFQLIAYLSILIAKTNTNLSDEFYVVSNDKDFELPIRYLSDKNDCSIKILKTTTNQSLNNSNIGCKYSKLHLEPKTLEALNNAKTLNDLHNNLNKIYGNTKGREIYLKVKDSFTNK